MWVCASDSHNESAVQLDRLVDSLGQLESLTRERECVCVCVCARARVSERVRVCVCMCA